ncbi:McrC family protein [Luteimicrobium subarcticum]|uniref:5-methylcytosine-specific restriction enzyme subunit McrC n=1 Tax=Luteimicrobium subarcticum TaxID=620910 RepID=A0A2M8WRJ7_9MICO|nr:restriction endonuclease [Luteimicrobium subarcticum]PJI93557.1 5-methylcytosine-specific restriction enzyme subunit McrC [Luteimicrobium subarcticum]
MRIEISENDTNNLSRAMSSDHAAALAATGLMDVSPSGVGMWRLATATNRVGAVRIGDLDVVVRPKATFGSVLFMLGYARDPGFTADEVDGLDADDVWPAVAETLVRLAERALRQGVLQGYVTREESLAVLRGRMRAADQVARRPGMLLPLEVTFDEYEVDIPENRIVRAALRRMALVPRLDRPLRARLAHLAGRLDGASDLVPGAPLPQWSPSRANSRYQPALRLGEQVLRSVGLSTTAGGASVAAFVVDMAVVFEDFVTVALREAFGVLSPLGRTVGQFGAWLDERSRVRARPDVVHTVRGVPRLVLDAKYKLGYSDGSYPTADVYQLHAYCTALGLLRGYLVYAGSRRVGAAPVEHRVLNTEIDVVQWPLDVSVPPAQLVAQVAELAAASVDVTAARTPATDAPG